MLYLKYIALMLGAIAGVVVVVFTSIWLCTLGKFGVLCGIAFYLAGFHTLRRLYKPYML